ncbi:Uncharacterised protein [uncultured archaeon]|nr:Uncharacterised protein [uncultured archaeon]
MKVLVASVYSEVIKSSKNFNDKWLKLQINFLDRHTKDYELCLYLNNVVNKDIFKDNKIIGETHEQFKIPNEIPKAHRFALRKVVQYFRDHQDEYDCFCILDSDCFPICDNWVEHLFNLVTKRNLKFSAVVRYENSELFPHPSAMFVPKKHILDRSILNFPDKFGNNSKNILEGGIYMDTGSDNSFWDGEQIGYPLIRTNCVNLHPVNAGIYGDIFYHHGFGSRFTSNESNEEEYSWQTTRYWKRHHAYFCKNNNLLFNLLFHNPVDFIECLRGKNMLDKLLKEIKQVKLI